VLHILGLARNLIYVSKMSDAGVHTLFQKDSCKMVKGQIALMRGVWNGTLYKLLGNVNPTGCNKIIAPEIDSTRSQHNSTRLKLIQFKPNRQDMMNSTPLGYGMRGWDTLQKRTSSYAKKRYGRRFS
jgi:hypothetical protein